MYSVGLNHLSLSRSLSLSLSLCADARDRVCVRERERERESARRVCHAARDKKDKKRETDRAGGCYTLFPTQTADLLPFTVEMLHGILDSALLVNKRPIREITPHILVLDRLQQYHPLAC